MGELFRPHNTAQAKQRSHQSQQAKEGGREQRAGHQRRQGHSMMKVYGTQSLILVVLFFVFVLFWVVFLQSKPSADNDKHEGEIKIYIQTKKWGFQDKKQKTQKQDRTTQSRKPRQSTD